MGQFFTRIIHFYQGISRYLFPATCRFYPSCSQYAIESMQKHGLAKGFLRACRRILRCAPFSPGGYDPVN